MTHPYLRYLRSETIPTVFCPGCGIGILMKAFFNALDELGYKDMRNFVFVSGIGCSAWIPSPHFKADSIHTLHGRAIPVAIGVKLVRPDLNVIVFGGDGDIAGIGGNHLLHAARRNVDILVIMVNNEVYGMTGGQVAPTTPLGMKTTTTPYGNPEPPLNVCNVVAASGGNYVARWTVGHYDQLVNSIKDAIRRKGFRFIEVLSPCTSRVSYRIGLTPAEHIKKLIKNSININKARKIGIENIKGKYIIGVFKDVDNPGYIDMIKEVLK